MDNLRIPPPKKMGDRFVTYVWIFFRSEGKAYSHHFCQACEQIKPKEEFDTPKTPAKQTFWKPNCISCHVLTRGINERANITEITQNRKLFFNLCKEDCEFNESGHITKDMRKKTFTQ